MGDADLGNSRLVHARQKLNWEKMTFRLERVKEKSFSH